MSLRRPRLALALALLPIVLLGLAGAGVEGKLEPTSLDVPGSGSARGEDLLREHFGESAPFVVLLRGPAMALDRQGPGLVAALRAEPGVAILSPWGRGGRGSLRPAPRKALVLVDFHVSDAVAVQDSVPRLEELLAERVTTPVRATQSGFATLSRALQDESVRSTRIAELVALPFLLLVLLLVFRSPVAAAIPLLFGALTVVAARGVLSLVAARVAVDGFALTVCSMMGLALGVDYALLIVSRFREELAAGAPPLRAAQVTRRTAGRTIAFAGATLVLAMAVTLLIMPGALLLSLAGTAIAVTALSVVIASLLAPPLLLLLGPGIDRWRLGGNGNGGRLMPMVKAALSRPALTAALTGAGLLLLALPALGLKTGPPSADQLPKSSQARRDAELIDEQIGAGWDAPFVVVAATERSPITSRARLVELARVQRRIATDPAVQAVIGPEQVSRRVAPVRRAGNDLLAGRGPSSPLRLRRLGDGLERATDGVGRLRDGLTQAAVGAGLLAAGSGRAGEGAGRIERGIERATSGADRAAAALDRLDGGSGRLATGQRRLQLAALSLQLELGELLPVLRDSGLSRARRLRSALRAAAAADPAFAADAREAERLVETLTVSRNEVQRLHRFAERLHDGQEKLAKGNADLHRGAARLATAAKPLPEGLARLGHGASALAAGLERLEGGAEDLSGHLAGGYRESQPLQAGLDRAAVRSSASASRLSDQTRRLRRSSPGLFDSGYFVLSALDGASPAGRRQAGEVIALDRGGQAAKLLVIPHYTFNTPGSRALGGRLREEADRLAERSGLRTGVTGGPAQLSDYDAAIAGRIPWVIAAVSLATFLGLVLVLRAIPLAAIAVALNLLTVGVAFGVLTLLFDVPVGWPLGGHTYVDAIGAAGIFGIVFGLSIDYAVFLLTRMREAREAGEENAMAIEHGLRRTARVITGAAAIMTVVFACFAAAPIATVSQLGVGLTVAVVLDATVVRIVLLPALMLLLGERVWWLPRVLRARLPKIDPHAV